MELEESKKDKRNTMFDFGGNEISDFMDFLRQRDARKEIVKRMQLEEEREIMLLE